MSQEKKPTLGFFVTVAIVAVVLVPALYVLSTGPALFLYDKGVIGEEAIAIAFAPLELVSDSIPKWAENVFEEYLTWWEALAESTEA